MSWVEDHAKRCPEGWAVLSRGSSFVGYRSPDGYEVLIGDDWEYDDPDDPTRCTCEVWFAYHPGDVDQLYPIGVSDWPHLDDAVNAVERHRARVHP